MGSPRRAEGPSFEEPADSWWDSLPRIYIVKRKWHEIVRFHEALVHDLAHLVKSKVPALPGKADLDSWTNSYAATGDACALSRRLKLNPPTAVAPQGGHHVEAPMDDLEGLHWIYVELRLAPYFVQVNNILRELPTASLAGSVALRRFALPGSRAAMQKAPCTANGVPRRFLGTLEPVSASTEDIDAAVQVLRRTDPAALRRACSAPSLGTGSPTGVTKRRTTATSKDKGASSTAAAAAKLPAL